MIKWIQNETIVICRNGHPVAELTSWQKKTNPLKQSAQLKNIIFKEDPSLPSTEEEWPEEAR